MKKVLYLSIALFIALSSVAYAAAKWNGMTIAKVFTSGQEVKTTVPAVVMKGATFIPTAMLKEFGLSVSAKGTNITVTKPIEKPAEPVKTPLTMDQLTMLMKHTVAMVYALDDNGKALTQGSGFAASSKGLVITAEHVVEEKGAYRNLRVVLDGTTYNVSKDQIIYKNAEKDIAAFRLPDGLYDYLPASSTKLERLEEVYTLSYPKGVSKIVQGKTIDHSKEILAFSMFVDHGSSGGALINRYGEAVGTITRGGDPVIAIGDAADLDLVKHLIQ